MTKLQWRVVTLEQHRALTDWMLWKGRHIFNGCTGTWLREEFGADNVKHVAGRGWYVRRQEERDQ
jgi:hypothetical protein